MWLAPQQRRQPCPFSHPILPPATRTQCDPCAAADPGQRLSLRRRANRLTPGHPWSSPPGLARLAEFYTDPAAALTPIDPDLTARLRTASWHPLRGYSLDRTIRYIRDLADRP